MGEFAEHPPGGGGQNKSWTGPGHWGVKRKSLESLGRRGADREDGAARRGVDSGMCYYSTVGGLAINRVSPEQITNLNTGMCFFTADNTMAFSPELQFSWRIVTAQNNCRSHIIGE